MLSMCFDFSSSTNLLICKVTYSAPPRGEGSHFSHSFPLLSSVGWVLKTNCIKYPPGIRVLHLDDPKFKYLVLICNPKYQKKKKKKPIFFYVKFLIFILEYITLKCKFEIR